MTLTVLIGAAIVLSAGYILQSRGIDTLELRAGRIRLVRSDSARKSKLRGSRNKQTSSE
jgi:hypothetical protein